MPANSLEQGYPRTVSSEIGCKFICKMHTKELLKAYFGPISKRRGGWDSRENENASSYSHYEKKKGFRWIRF